MKSGVFCVCLSLCVCAYDHRNPIDSKHRKFHCNCSYFNKTEAWKAIWNLKMLPPFLRGHVPVASDSLCASDAFFPSGDFLRFFVCTEASLSASTVINQTITGWGCLLVLVFRGRSRLGAVRGVALPLRRLE